MLIRAVAGVCLVSLDVKQKYTHKSHESINSGDLRQGSSNNSATNFVLRFPHIFQRETQPSFEDLLLVVLVILRQRSVTRFRPKVSVFNFAISEQYFRFPFDLHVLPSQFYTQKIGKILKISNPSGSFHKITLVTNGAA